MTGMAAFVIQTIVTANPSQSPCGVVPGKTSSGRRSARADVRHRVCTAMAEGDHHMSTTRHPVAFLVALFTLVIWSGVPGGISAQQSLGMTPLVVGVSGTADIGGSFQGTLMLTRFESLATNDGIVAVGSLAGSLNGRNIATRVAIPVTVAPSATPNAVTAGVGSCDSVHLNLEPSALRALGAVVRLGRSSVDITTSQPQTSGFAVAPPAGAMSTATVATPTSSGIGTISTFPGADLRSSASATPVPSAPVSSTFPGVISPAPQTSSAATATSVQQLGPLLCSVSALMRTSSSPAPLADALNRVLLALVQ